MAPSVVGENVKQGEAGSDSDRLVSPLPPLKVDLSGANEYISSCVERLIWCMFGIWAYA